MIASLKISIATHARYLNSLKGVKIEVKSVTNVEIKSASKARIYIPYLSDQTLYPLINRSVQPGSKAFSKGKQSRHISLYHRIPKYLENLGMWLPYMPSKKQSTHRTKSPRPCPFLSYLILSYSSQMFTIEGRCYPVATVCRSKITERFFCHSFRMFPILRYYCWPLCRTCLEHVRKNPIFI